MTEFQKESSKIKRSWDTLKTMYYWSFCALENLELKAVLFHQKSAKTHLGSLKLPQLNFCFFAKDGRGKGKAKIKGWRDRKGKIERGGAVEPNVSRGHIPSTTRHQYIWLSFSWDFKSNLYIVKTVGPISIFKLHLLYISKFSTFTNDTGRHQ